MTIKINLTNRWLYTLIVIGILILLGIVVYGYVNPSTGVGHDPSEIGPGTFAGGGDYIFPDTSKVGIGTSPSFRLDLGGGVIKAQKLYSGNNYYVEPEGTSRIYNIEVVNDINLCYCIQCKNSKGWASENCARLGIWTGIDETLDDFRGCQIKIYLC